MVQYPIFPHTRFKEMAAFVDDPVGLLRLFHSLAKANGMMLDCRERLPRQPVYNPCDNIHRHDGAR